MRNDSLRIGDAERDAAIAALARHFADGRLTQDEHEERTGLALRARIGADLRVLFADLPRLDAPTQAPAPAPRRPSSGRLILSSVASALLVMAGVFVMLHLLPIVALVAFAFIASRIFIGGRRWSSRSYRSDWPRDAWHRDSWHGGGFYRR